MEQSHAFSLLENKADEAEQREAALKIADKIVAAVAGWQAECRVMRDIGDEEITRFVEDELGGFVRLVGGGWPDAHRQEFIDQCVLEFADVPIALLEPAVRRARREVYDPKRFVSWIFDFIDKPLVRLQLEGVRLMDLARLAGV